MIPAKVTREQTDERRSRSARGVTMEGRMEKRESDRAKGEGMQLLERVPVKRTFAKQFMFDTLDGEEGAGQVVLDTVVGKRRWSVTHELVFAYEDKLYRTTYEVGATEQQAEGPWEHVNDVTCTEVESYEKVITAYRPVLQEPTP